MTRYRVSGIRPIIFLFFLFSCTRPLTRTHYKGFTGRESFLIFYFYDSVRVVVRCHKNKTH